MSDPKTTTTVHCPYGGRCECPERGVGGRTCPSYSTHVDIVERLRSERDVLELSGSIDGTILDEAADEIEFARAALMKILKPSSRSLRRIAREALQHVP